MWLVITTRHTGPGLTFLIESKSGLFHDDSWMIIEEFLVVAELLDVKGKHAA